MIRPISFILLFPLLTSFCKAQQEKDKNNIAVIAYYAGRSNTIDSFEIEKLTHLIFSFCHLKGNRLSVDHARDSATITDMVGFKKKKSVIENYSISGRLGRLQNMFRCLLHKKRKKRIFQVCKATMQLFWN